MLIVMCEDPISAFFVSLAGLDFIGLYIVDGKQASDPHQQLSAHSHDRRRGCRSVIINIRIGHHFFPLLSLEP
ncbi:hypothetical protein ACS0TY_027376 [Phlomoides rotata]